MRRAALTVLLCVAAGCPTSGVALTSSVDDGGLASFGPATETGLPTTDETGQVPGDSTDPSMADATDPTTDDPSDASDSSAASESADSTTGDPSDSASDDASASSSSDPSAASLTDTASDTAVETSSGGVPAACGDGVVDPGEECDDGNASDECNADCTISVCGDGLVNEAANELCDDAGESADCNADCTFASCGDGLTNEAAGEDCDDDGESNACDADCTEASCGDQVTNISAGESCDAGGSTPNCDGDCTPVDCGDDFVNAAAGEDCDDGNNGNQDGCSASCELEIGGGNCYPANGLQWCFNNEACGQACEDVCTSLGLTVIADNNVWFAAQDTAQECQAISDALGMVDPIQLNSWSYACLEDSALNDAVGGGLTGALYCSTYANCPQDHRTNMDQLGIACGPGARRSICPCN